MTTPKKLSEIELRQTCGACPEQYDAFMGEKQVGYLRLRHGFFSVDCPDVGGKQVFATSEVSGDGMFTDEERPGMLAKAKESIAKWLETHEEA